MTDEKNSGTNLPAQIDLYSVPGNACLLYTSEAETLTANPALREMLNRLYDNFTERFGRLNDKRNLDLIKIDARGTEILSLERYIDGKARKAD